MHRARSGSTLPPRLFTLVELLVVVAILSILAALLLPALSQARFAANMAVCTSNLKQITTGLHSYGHDNRNWYPAGRYARYWPYAGDLSGNLLSYYGYKHTAHLVDRPLFQCPQGLTEVPWKPGSSKNTHSGSRASYYLYPDLMLGISAAAPGSSAGKQTPANPERMMRRIGQSFTQVTGWGDIPREFHVVASDICVNTLSSVGYGVQTNHILSGDTYVQVHFNVKPGYFNTKNVRAKTNYAMDDGSVRLMDVIGPLFGKTMNRTGSKGWAIPTELGRAP